MDVTVERAVILEVTAGAVLVVVLVVVETTVAPCKVVVVVIGLAATI